MAALEKTTDPVVKMCEKLRESHSFTQPDRQSEDIPSHPLTLSSSSPDQRKSSSLSSKRRPQLYRGKDNLVKFLNRESTDSTDYSLALPMTNRQKRNSDGEQSILHHFRHVRHHDSYGGEPETRLKYDCFVTLPHQMRVNLEYLKHILFMIWIG